MRLAIGAFFASLVVAAPADATFRGHNGLIAFTASGSLIEEAAVSINAVAPSGGAELTLVPNASHPEWSPDGKHLAFDTHGLDPQHGGDFDLDVADADGNNLHQIARPDTDEYAPSWSPNGKRLVFVLDDGIESNRSGIYTVNPNGSALRLVRRAHGEYLDSPVWSPNGKWIAFSGEAGYARHAEQDLFVVRPNGKGLRRLTRTGSDEGKPSWSPDSTRLVFARRRGDISVLTLRTGRQHDLISGSDDDNDPVWSPDGTTIAFVRTDFVDEVGMIYLARANGQEVRRLTTLPTYAYALAWQTLP
jgi:TolB protein